MVASVRTGELAVRIHGVPVDCPVKVAVFLGGKATETLALDLRRQPTLCLVLTHGYANWRVADSASPQCGVSSRGAPPSNGWVPRIEHHRPATAD